MGKHILILGATSGIGRDAMDEALDRGHRVRAFARTADTLDGRPGLEPVVGDAYDADQVAFALQGVDAVIYALGIKESLSMIWTPVSLFSDTTAVLLPQMKTAGVSRLLVVTGFGAGRSRAAMSSLERIGHRAILGKPYEDKDRQEDQIEASDTDWTLVRPVILTNGAKTGKYRVLRDPSQWRNGLISRADVAHYLVTAIEDDLDIRADVVLAR
ncbi:NADH-flavin reductase [Jannaschia pagri]|uniref:NADH-flavin reductase n=1 Tax=Jannaschia pagri TaxID=2829797 RepID=A0ABQ4NPH6_9RHOB|nr:MULTISPECIES: NAD(P)-binding oxidoreductase [unclassified Jannaschia]GIT92345.1 NADH-flavin reductase [Jannaschia sp. AI_61]GIT96180.1 NADH-flavin reductase [Jannaschia sp. AI_62]